MAEISVSGVAAQGKVTLVEVSGRIDSMNANELGEALSDAIAENNVHLVLDLSQVEYMSSAGLREMVAAFKSARRAAGDLRIAQPSERVREVLEMAGLDAIFQIFPTQAQAVQSY